MKWKFWQGKSTVRIDVPKGTWHELTSKIEVTLGWRRWAYIRDNDGRLLTEVTKHNGPEFDVYKNGKGYGAYMTLEAAKKKAEEIA